MALFREKFFPAASGALWLVFLFLDLTKTGDSTWIKFTAICLCCAAALTGAKSRDGQLVALALCFTVAADWFLLVRNDRYAVGIALFLCVQTVYYLRLRRMGAGAACPLRAGLALGLGVGLYLLRLASPVNLLAGLYFSQLLSNTVLAWRSGRPGRLFAVGLTLFVGCDVCVGLFNALPPGSPPYSAASVGMWFFYLPSQVLITLSALPGKEEAHEIQ